LHPQNKLAADFLFVLCVVATPTKALWAFASYLLLIGIAARLGEIPPRYLLKGLVIEVPFVLFAVALPFVSPGERVEVLGLDLSEDGLWSAWNILAKATLGLAAALIVAATTPLAALLYGLERLHMPRVFTAIAGFMVRYGDVISGEMSRMRIARECRGYEPRWIWQARAVGASAGSLFIRSYERGERVYLAMVSRGFDGSLPSSRGAEPGLGEWAASMVWPAIAACVAAAAWILT